MKSLNNKKSKPNRLPVVLVSLITVAGLVAVGCGTSTERGIDVETRATSTGTSQNVFDTLTSTTASASSAELEPVGADLTYTKDLTCAEQFPTSEEVTIRNAEAMLGQIQTSFNDIPEDDAKTLALAFSLCGVRYSEVESLLADDELGEQYHDLIHGVFSERYEDFVDTYRNQVCLVASFDGEIEIESESRLNRLIGAVTTAALIFHMPSDEDIEALVDTFIENTIEAIWDQVILGNSVEQSDADSDEAFDEEGDFVATSSCEMIIRKVDVNG